MCYDKGYKARKDFNYANRYASEPGLIDHYQSQLDFISSHHYVSGFSHPIAPVITDERPGDIQGYQWGLIPFWCKDPKSALKLSNQTLNARGETIFEKPAFRASARSRRCLIICIDGFFEHHHVVKKKIPFFIKLKNQEPMTLAGLWDRWEDKQNGIVRYSYSVVTTRANPVMEKIHNNPNAEGPRMPLILPRELERDWLKEITDPLDKEAISSLIQPYPAEELQAIPVRQLKGKAGVGDSELSQQYFGYDELASDLVA